MSATDALFTTDSTNSVEPKIKDITSSDEINIAKKTSITFVIGDIGPGPERNGICYLGPKHTQPAVVQKYFGDRSEVTIPITPIVLNAGYGGFSLSTDVFKLIDAKKTSIDSETKNVHYKCLDLGRCLNGIYDTTNLIDERIDDELIEIIREIGFKQASSGTRSELIFKYIPSAYTNCVEIDETDGAEIIRFNMRNEIFKILSESDNVSDLDKQYFRLLELSFIDLNFHCINYHYINYDFS